MSHVDEPSARVGDDRDPPYDATPCAVEAFGVVAVPFGAIAGLRKTLGPASGRKVPPSLLKHADHQTVLALAGVLKAVDDSGWRDREFTDWGMVAAPRFQGRLNAAAALHRFRQSGASGVSPLIVPTLCLHAVAGSLSLAMRTHGFNYGVGGGHGHLAEALMTGLAARDDDGVPGVWVVATQFDPEVIPDAAGHCSNDSVGYAVALAITAAGAARSRLNLRQVATAASVGTVEPGPDASLPALAEFLTTSPGAARARRWYCPLLGAGAIELDDDPARASGRFDERASVSRAG